MLKIKRTSNLNNCIRLLETKIIIIKKIPKKGQNLHIIVRQYGEIVEALRTIKNLEYFHKITKDNKNLKKILQINKRNK